MTLSRLKSVVASYFDRKADDLVTNDGVDLFLELANETRRTAEMNWNFEFSRVRAEMDIDGIIGGDLDQAMIEDPTVFAATILLNNPTSIALGTYGFAGFFNNFPYYINDLGFFLYFNTGMNNYIISAQQTASVLTDLAFVLTPSSTTSPVGNYNGIGTYVNNNVKVAISVPPLFTINRIKEVVAFQRQRADQRRIPIDFTRADIPIERDRWIYELRDDFWPSDRYPSDAQLRARTGRSTLIQRGRKIFIYPAWPPIAQSTPLHVFMECIGLLRDYVSTDYAATTPVDFLLDFGSQYMKWELIMQLNPVYQKFVPRQEGNVGNEMKLITQYRDEAWRKLTVWDSYQIDANSSRSR